MKINKDKYIDSVVSAFGSFISATALKVKSHKEVTTLLDNLYNGAKVAEYFYHWYCTKTNPLSEVIMSAYKIDKYSEFGYKFADVYSRHSTNLTDEEQANIVSQLVNRLEELDENPDFHQFDSLAALSTEMITNAY